MRWTSLPIALAAALLLLGGSWRVTSGGGEGWPLIVLGAVAFGAWVHSSGRDDK